MRSISLFKRTSGNYLSELDGFRTTEGRYKFIAGCCEDPE